MCGKWKGKWNKPEKKSSQQTKLDLLAT